MIYWVFLPQATSKQHESLTGRIGCHPNLQLISKVAFLTVGRVILIDDDACAHEKVRTAQDC